MNSRVLAGLLFALSLPVAPACIASGKALSDCTVWTLNEGCWDRPAADLAASVPSDYLMRAWFKWWQARDYQKEKLVIPIAKSHGALFGGGITVSALYRDENGLSEERWRRLATRDPSGQIPQGWGKANIAHGAIGSEEYLDYCLGWCYAQIDAGADSIFLDEVEGAYSPLEGFDDASITKFAGWLTRRYCGALGWIPRDPRWSERLKIDTTDPQECPDGTDRQFQLPRLPPQAPLGQCARRCRQSVERRLVGLCRLARRLGVRLPLRPHPCLWQVQGPGGQRHRQWQRDRRLS